MLFRNLKAAKDAARRLTSRLKKDEINIPHSLGLEAIASVMGHKNWNVASASLSLTTREIFKSPILGIQPRNPTKPLDEEPHGFIDVGYSGVVINPSSLEMVDSSKGVVLEGRAGPRLEINIRPLTTQYGTFMKVESIHDAEMLALRMATDISLPTFDPSKMENKDIDPWVALPIMINRQANLIAARTRRGAGNSIMMSRRIFETKLLPMVASENAFVSGEFIEPQAFNSHFSFCGRMNGSMRIFISDFIPDDIVYVAWKPEDSELDAGAFYLTGDSENQSDYLFVPHRSMGRLQDFITAINLKL